MCSCYDLFRLGPGPVPEPHPAPAQSPEVSLSQHGCATHRTTSHDTRNYDKLTGHLNPVKILNLQRYLQLANKLYN